MYEKCSADIKIKSIDTSDEEDRKIIAEMRDSFGEIACIDSSGNVGD
jgi:hypothetical protein